MQAALEGSYKLGYALYAAFRSDCREKNLWKLDNTTTAQDHYTKGWEPLELSMVFNPDPSQLSLVVKNTMLCTMLALCNALCYS